MTGAAIDSTARLCYDKDNIKHALEVTAMTYRLASARDLDAVSLYQKNGYRRLGAARWRKGSSSLMEKRL